MNIWELCTITPRVYRGGLVWPTVKHLGGPDGFGLRPWPWWPLSYGPIVLSGGGGAWPHLGEWVRIVSDQCV